MTRLLLLAALLALAGCPSGDPEPESACYADKHEECDLFTGECTCVPNERAGVDGGGR